MRKNALYMIAISVIAFIIVFSAMYIEERLLNESEYLQQQNIQEIYVEYLGNPFINQYTNNSREEIIARNVWDMQYHEGNIFLACGDYDTNMGKVPLWYYNTYNKSFELFTYLDEEMTNNFILSSSGSLIIPGIDSTSRNKVANWYEIADNCLNIYQTIPQTYHCFDIVEYHNNYFYALGSDIKQIAKSADGINFEFIPVVRGNKEIQLQRIYNLFVLNDTLYAIDTNSSITKIYEYYEDYNLFIRTQNIDLSNMKCSNMYANNGGFPITRKIAFDNQIIFVNKILYLLSEIETLENISPNPNERYFDIIKRNDLLYLLSGKYISEACWEMNVYCSSDCTNWDKLFTFNTTTYARSFELDDLGYFYFGLGSDYADANLDNGKILRIYSGF